MTVRSIQAS